MNLFSTFCAWIIAKFAWLVTGFHVTWRSPLGNKPCVYIANHRSHTDFVMLWAALPKKFRKRTRPVAGADYWEASALRRFIACRVFNALLIPRGDADMREKIQAMMLAAIENGDSLILFPEGTRNLTDEILLPLKSGIFYLAKQRPNLEIVPVWLENLGRVMPKGALLPAPLLCSVKFGEAQQISITDDKESFLQRLRMALLSLSIEERQKND